VSANGQERPRVLFVGRTRYRLPLPGWLAKKWDALERQLDFRVVASAHDRSGPLADERFRLLAPSRLRRLDGVLFYLRAPLALRREIRGFRPEVIVAESPYTGAAALLGRLLSGRSPRVVVEVHGDWRTATRLYGSPRRRALSPVADAVSRLALRRGDAVRAVSPYTGGLVEDVRGIPVTATFPTYTDLAVFAGREPVALPERPTAVFVGMLELYKNVDGLATAWREVVGRLPDARLVLVGKGSRRELVEELVRELPEQVEWHPELPPEGVARALDEATVLVLPSRSEGLPRVLMEAFARGRGAVGSRQGGGIPELVHDGETGLLVDAEDPQELADALVRVLSDRQLAERLGRNAHAVYASVHTTPGEYAERVRALVEASLREGGALPGERPRVLFVTRRPGAGEETLRSVRDAVDSCVIGRAERGERPVRTALGPGSLQVMRRWPDPVDGLLFHLALPGRVRSLVRRFRPQVVVAETPHLGFLVLVGLALRRRGRPSLVIETYEDWRAAARTGGSRVRVVFAPLADWAARYALRRADALRAVSPYTAALAERAAGVPPVESFPGYIDLAAFTERAPQPLPTRPAALFVGMLERSKDVSSLVEAWPSVAAAVPDARLLIVGRGALLELIERLRDDFPDSVEHIGELPPSGVAERLDEATCLVLPSRSEGLGRVILESFARGRSVVATRVGGIPDLVEDGRTGLLVEERSPEALAAALVRVLGDPALAQRLGEAAHAVARELRWSPDDYAVRVRRLVERTLAETART
jgi:glycosyltransferase involved in cell wall biosynthesis